MASLGERFLLYRLPEAISEDLADAALEHVGCETAMRDELSAAAISWWDCLPALRRRALEHLITASEAQSTTHVATALDHPAQTVRRKWPVWTWLSTDFRT
jgi:hypothetical protein